MKKRPLTIKKLFATTIVVAVTCFVASHASGEFDLDIIYLTFLAGAVSSLFLLGLCRPSDTPFAALLLTPFTWAAATAWWQSSFLGGFLFSPFTYGLPSFHNVWVFGLPLLYLLLTMVAITNPAARSKRLRIVICVVGLVPITSIAAIRRYERSNWEDSVCSMGSPDLADVDPEELSNAIESFLAAQEDATGK